MNGERTMTQQNEPRTDELAQLTSREMQDALGGACVECLLKVPGVERESTSYVGTANRGVWKTTNF
jgi:hypothetical protein